MADGKADEGKEGWARRKREPARTHLTFLIEAKNRNFQATLEVDVVSRVAATVGFLASYLSITS